MFYVSFFYKCPSENVPAWFSFQLAIILPQGFGIYLKNYSLILFLCIVVFVRSNIAQSLYENNNNNNIRKFLILCFLCSCLLCCQNVHDLIFKLILGYCAMRCNLFIYMNLMWIEKNQDKSSCTAYNQITPGLYIYVGSDSNQWFSFIAFQDVFAPSVQW